jgi:hypothetical protein
MRIIFGVLSLLIGLGIVSYLNKKQIASINDIKVPGVPTITVDPNASVQQQSQQIQNQVKSAVEGALSQPRAMPDEKP